MLRIVTEKGPNLQLMPGGNVSMTKNHMHATGSYSPILELQNGVTSLAIGAELVKIQLVKKYRLNGQLVGYACIICIAAQEICIAPKAFATLPTCVAKAS
jgi:hypothetical protein